MSEFSHLGVSVRNRHEAINIAICQSKNITGFGANWITIVKLGWNASSGGRIVHPWERQFTLPPGFSGRSLPVSMSSVPSLLTIPRSLISCVPRDHTHSAYGTLWCTGNMLPPIAVAFTHLVPCALTIILTLLVLPLLSSGLAFRVFPPVCTALPCSR